MAGDKIYMGSVKARQSQFGEELDFGLDCTNIDALFKEYGYISKGGKKILNLRISRRREVSQYGETHSATVNTWKPSGAQGSTQGTSNGNGYQKRAESPSKPLSGSANGVPSFDDEPPDFPDDIPF